MYYAYSYLIRSVGVLARKRIYNPRTGHYYRIASRSNSKYRKGQIKGRRSPKKKCEKQDEMRASTTLY